jgi:hypothetical protein
MKVRLEEGIRSDPLLPVLGKGAWEWEERVLVIDQSAWISHEDEDHMIIPHDQIILSSHSCLLFPEGNL